MIFRRLKWKFRDWKFNRRMAKQRKKKGFADCDCWGMDYWFCETFVKMIRTLRDMKHGAPEKEFEEFDNFPLSWVNQTAPTFLKQKQEKYNEDELDLWGEEKYFDRWWFVLERIAWCLEQAGKDYEDPNNPDLVNEYQEEYHNQVWGDDEKKSFKQWWKEHFVVSKTDKKGKPMLWQLKTNEPDEELKNKYYQRELEIADYKEKCKDEAFDLIKKYFYHLWD